MENSQRLFPTLNYSTSVVEACDRADAVLVLTEWREFVELDPHELASTVARQSLLVDGRQFASTLTCGAAQAGGSTPLAGRWTSVNQKKPALSIPVEALPQQHEYEFRPRVSRGTSRFSYHQVATPWFADCVARARIHAALGRL